MNQRSVKNGPNKGEVEMESNREVYKAGALVFLLVTGFFVFAILWESDTESVSRWHHNGNPIVDGPDLDPPYAIVTTQATTETYSEKLKWTSVKEEGKICLQASVASDATKFCDSGFDGTLDYVLVGANANLMEGEKITAVTVSPERWNELQAQYLEVRRLATIGR
jgi:hypothetical protein